MKKTLLIVLTALSALALANEAGAQAAASANENLLGRFARTTETAMLGFESAEVCERNTGRWIEGDCFLATEDFVAITAGPSGLKILIETNGATGGFCEYEAPALLSDANTLVSTMPAQEWNGSAFVPATCEVQVRANDDGTVNVRNNGKCDRFCEARAWLEIDSATRQ